MEFALERSACSLHEPHITQKVSIPGIQTDETFTRFESGNVTRSANFGEFYSPAPMLYSKQILGWNIPFLVAHVNSKRQGALSALISTTTTTKEAVGWPFDGQK